MTSFLLCSLKRNYFIQSSKVDTNLGADIQIGHHVWLCRDVSVLKGVSIADGCVVGTGSIVTKSLCEKDSLYVGSPAKKIKSDIEWYRETIPEYLKHKK